MQQPVDAQSSQLRGGAAGRDTGVDLVRALGIVAIVVGHVITTAASYRLIFTWHVPLFFFLSGVYWREGRTLPQEWAARWRTLGRPYIGWLVLISIFAIPMAIANSPRALVRRLGSIVLGGTYLKTPYTAFWFFTCLMAACLICRLARTRNVSWLVIGAVGAAATLAGPWLRYVPLSVGTALPCIVFVAAGRGYALAPKLLRHPLSGLLALGVAATAVATGVSRPLFIKNGDFGVPLLGSLVAVLVAWGLLAAASGLPRRMLPSSFSLVVATYGSAVILAHGLPLDWFYGHLQPGIALAAVAAVTALFVVAASFLPWRDMLLTRTSRQG